MVSVYLGYLAYRRRQRRKAAKRQETRETLNLCLITWALKKLMMGLANHVTTSTAEQPKPKVNFPPQLKHTLGLLDSVQLVNCTNKVVHKDFNNYFKIDVKAWFTVITHDRAWILWIAQEDSA